MKPLQNWSNAEEIEYFGKAVRDFLDHKTDADRFTAIRLQQGVYGQRQEGVNMIRVKLPGGRVDAPGLLAIADVLKRYVRDDHEVVHITTRQDIQIHYVPLEHTPAALRRLGQGGLTTREACGNTLRNMTACPLAGVCPREHTDVNVHLDGAVAHFLRNPLNQQLPRKFKISFSGCEADCAQGMFHDLAVIAVRDGKRHGFKVLAGGGLGHKPREALVVEPFVEEKDLIKVMEALVALHNRYSDRVKRAKARIKFLVDRFGAEGFLVKYREELVRTRSALEAQHYPQGDWRVPAPGEIPGSGVPRRVFPQKQAGRSVVPASVPMGDLRAVQLEGLAQLLNRFQLPMLKVTQDQNLLIPDVPDTQVGPVSAALAALGLGLPQAGDNVVACPGTSTCRLGITSSPILGPKLSGGPHNLRIRVSGCHNGCAQPEAGDIGIYGEGRRLHGRLVPHYQTYFGGDGMAGRGLAIKGPSIPAARIETAVDRVKQAYAAERQADEAFFEWSRRVGIQRITDLLKDLTVVAPEDLQSVARDHGTTTDFRVLQLGGGECAGANQMQVGANFFEAAHERMYRDALLFQRKYGDAVQCAETVARLVAQAAVQLAGGPKQEDLALLAEELSRLLPEHAGLGEALARWHPAVLQVEAHTDKGLAALFAEQDSWTTAVAALCLAREPQLDLNGALPRNGTADPAQQPALQTA